MQATPLFDRLVFSKVRKRLGGRVKLIVSGGAPLAGKSPVSLLQYTGRPQPRSCCLAESAEHCP